MRSISIRRLIVPMAAVALLAGAHSADATDAPPADTTADTTAGSDAPAGDVEQADLNVGVIPIVDILPLPAAVNDGTFESAGLNVTMENAAGGAAIIPGVVAGEFDIGFSNVYSVLKAAEEGLPIRIIAAGPFVGDTDFSAITTLDPEITSVADLEGKTVSVNTLNGIAEFTVRETLAAAGVTDVELIEVAFPETTAAMEAGQIDAAFQVEPFVTQAVEAGATVLAQPFSASQPNMMVAVWFTTDDFIENNPNTVAAFVDAVNASNEKVQGDRDFANEQLLTYTATPSIEAAAALTLPEFHSEIDVDSLAESVAIGVKYGFLTGEGDLNELVYTG